MLERAGRAEDGRRLLALAPHRRLLEALRGRVEARRPLGCTACEFAGAGDIALGLAREFGQDVGWYARKGCSNEVRAVDELLSLFEGGQCP